ncbi:MerR family transcriptional regulator [Sciscionella sediminilitoris]|uniref:MerR family transcriptional regulator n=1 Tax=Sciscionella sediminilitoris TaxID=1445613 RepID=UPI00055CCE99|nr:MerR family transcriptional regulator [Sciscionella sp. SE31]
MRIGELCARTGTTPRMVRHYERAGILSPARESNRYRTFTEEDVELVLDTRCLLDAGLSLTDAAEIVRTVCGAESAPLESLDKALDRIRDRQLRIATRIDELLGMQGKLDELYELTSSARLSRAGGR